MIQRRLNHLLHSESLNTGQIFQRCINHSTKNQIFQRSKIEATLY